MALSRVVNSRGVQAALPPPADTRLQAALLDFRNALSPQQRAILQAQGPPGPEAVIQLTTEIDAHQAQSRQRCIGTRLQYLLESVTSFTTVVDTFVSSNPNTAALIWGSVKLALLLAMRISPYLERVTKLFMDLKPSYPRLSIYRGLFRDSLRVQSALCNYYAEIVNCCRYLITLTKSNGFLDLVKSVVWPFDQDFSRMTTNLDGCCAQLKEEIRLATVQSLTWEREEASAFRNIVGRQLQQSSLEEKRKRDLQAAKEADKASLRWQALLEKLSCHNHFIDYKRARQRQKGETASWVKETVAFKEWYSGGHPPILWFSGKLGTGKTVATSNLVSHLFTDAANSYTVTFFFCQFDNQKTLATVNILSSLLRQYLEVNGYNPETEKKLSRLLSFSAVDLEDLVQFFKETIAKTLFVVIDGLDECPEEEQSSALDALKSLASVDSKLLRILVASRYSLKRQIELRWSHFHHISTECLAAKPYVSEYVDICIDEAYEKKELILGDQAVLGAIKQKLKSYGRGMFLWIAFQIQELCLYTRDEDILQALEDLPPDLPATYQRILSRITGTQAELLKPVFDWVLVARQPLTLAQLREAIAIEPCQPYTIEKRIRKDMFRAIEWSKSLLVLDDDDSTVQLTHPSVKQFFLDRSRPAILAGCSFDNTQLESLAGEVCVTYLHFSDFERTLVGRYPGGAEAIPKSVYSKVIAESSKSKTVSRIAERFWRLKTTGQAPALGRALDDAKYTTYQPVLASQSAELGHPFLSYASQFWLVHSAAYDPSFKTYNLWIQLLFGSHHLAYTPWTVEEWDRGDQKIWDFINANDHGALLYFMGNNYDSFSHQQAYRVLLEVMRNANRRVLSQLLKLQKPWHSIVSDFFTLILAKTVDEGDVDLITWVLRLGVDPDAQVPLAKLTRSHLDYDLSRIEIESWKIQPNELTSQLLTSLQSYRPPVRPQGDPSTGALSLTPLAFAVTKGHEKLAFVVMDAGARVNGYQLEGGETLLISAIKDGYRSIAVKLITRGADVEQGSRGNRMKPLIAAIEHLPDLATLLIDAGASIHATQSDGKSPLIAATQFGRHKLIEQLLDAGADIKAAYAGLSLLALAVQTDDCRDTVKLLLARGAQPSSTWRHSIVPPLALAVSLRDTAIMSTLIKAGAWVDETAELRFERSHLVENSRLPEELKIDDGFTALHAASALGEQDAVDLLLRHRATTGIETANTKTALFLAARRSHLTITKKLISRGKAGGDQGAEMLRRTVYQTLVGHNADTLRLLVTNGVNPNIAHPELQGRTSLQYAIDTKDKAMEKVWQFEEYSDSPKLDNDGNFEQATK